MSTQTTTGMELEIIEALTQSKVDTSLVEFRQRNSISYCIRFNYWQKISPEVYEKIKQIAREYGYNLRECEMHDEDCGWLYRYRFDPIESERISIGDNLHPLFKDIFNSHFNINRRIEQ